MCICIIHTICAQVKPFSEVVSRLADDLGVVKERIMLSYQSESVPLNATPDSLGLTTVDFLGELKALKFSLNDRQQCLFYVYSFLGIN